MMVINFAWLFTSLKIQFSPFFSHFLSYQLFNNSFQGDHFLNLLLKHIRYPRSIIVFKVKSSEVTHTVVIISWLSLIKNTPRKGNCKFNFWSETNFLIKTANYWSNKHNYIGLTKQILSSNIVSKKMGCCRNFGINFKFDHKESARIEFN